MRNSVLETFVSRNIMFVNTPWIGVSTCQGCFLSVEDKITTSENSKQNQLIFKKKKKKIIPGFDNCCRLAKSFCISTKGLETFFRVTEIAPEM